jgi:hypothetical protein
VTGGEPWLIAKNCLSVTGVKEQDFTSNTWPIMPENTIDDSTPLIATLAAALGLALVSQRAAAFQAGPKTSIFLDGSTSPIRQ